MFAFYDVIADISTGSPVETATIAANNVVNSPDFTAHPMSHEHCSDEAHPHDHAGHSHTPPPDSAAAGDQFSLYAKIDRDNVVALNAVGGEQAGRAVIK